MKYFRQSSLALLLSLGLLPILSHAQKAGLKPGAVDPGNYYSVRNEYLKNHPEQEAEEKEREGGDLKHVKEDQSREAFEQWDWYWRDHQDATSHIPGKMADVGKYLSNYLGARSSGNNLSVGGSPSVCQTSLGNWALFGPSAYSAPMIGRVSSMWVNPTNFSEIYAGSAGGGIFHTVNAGSYVSWAPVNQADASGNRLPSPDITTIAVDQTNSPNTIYCGGNNGSPTGWGLDNNFGFGVNRSTDGGITWSNVLNLSSFNSTQNTDFVRAVKIHPQDHNTVYVLAGQTVFRTSNATNASPTWTPVLTIPNMTYCMFGLSDIEIINGTSGVSNSVVAVSTDRESYDGSANSSCGSAHMYISTAGGNTGTFTDVTTNVVGSFVTDRISMALQPGNTSEIFATYATCVGGPGSPYLYFNKINVSTLAVTSIGSMSDGFISPGAGYWDLEFEFSPNNPNYFYVGGQVLYKYNITGGGFTYTTFSDYWANSSTMTHGDVRSMRVMPVGTTSDLILLGDDGGLQQTIVTSTSMTQPSWTNLNGNSSAGNPMAITQFFGLAGSESNYNLLVAGAQDNATQEYFSGNWYPFDGGDGWKGVINPQNNHYYGFMNGGALSALTGPVNATPFTGAATPSAYGGPNVRIAMNPNNPNILYACSNNSSGNYDVWRSTNFGGSWAQISFPADQNSIRSIRVAPNASDTVYVVKDGPTWGASGVATSNRIYMGYLNGSTWTWKDIGAGSSCAALINGLSWAVATDVAIDPNNANRIWVTFNGYFNVGSTSQGVSRVVCTPDCGSNWYDATNNLPPFPVNCIVYQNGSNDVLYIGTDVGVFQFASANTTPGVGTWNCFNQGLPVVPVLDLEINNCKSKLRCATYGRGIYASDLPVTTDFVINTNTNWYGNHFVPGDIFITGNATLNVYGTIYMGGGKRIKVNRGAVLNVHPTGVLTNYCGDMWQGVEVYGNSSVAQNVSGAQGVCVMQGGSTLSNALEGISAAQMSGGNPVTGYTGGIVECTGALFTNNRRDAALYSYHWYIGSAEQANISYFKNCTFQTTASLNDPAQALNTHVTFNDVYKPTIVGCTFTNTTSNTVYSANYRGAGITSSDATYTVDNYYRPNINPPVLISSSAFNGMTSGVTAAYTNPTGKQVIVKNAAFTGNLRGVLISNGNNPMVTSNTMSGIPVALTTAMVDATYGIDLFNCTNLNVSCNTVSGTYSSTANNYGTIIDNCGSSTSNAVSNNTYSNLYAGIQAQGNNGSGTSGVQLMCNTFQSSMSYQLSVCPQYTGSIANQGSTCSIGYTRQNNFFSPVSSNKQIIATNATVNYWASGSIPTVLSGYVNVTACTSVSGECSSSCTSGGGMLSGDMNTSSTEDNARLLTELESLTSPEREMALSGAYIQEGNTAKVFELMTWFRKNDMPEAVFFFGKEQELNQSRLSWYDLSASDKEEMRRIAAGSTPTASYAQAVVQMIDGKISQPAIERIPQPAEELTRPLAANGQLLNNVPNPFDAETMIECTVGAEAHTSILRITDALGNQLKSFQLVQGNNRITVSASEFAGGVYYYSLVIDGKHVITKKMVVVH